MNKLQNVTITINNKTVRIQNNLDDTQKEQQIMMVFCAKPVTCKATAEIKGKKYTAKIVSGKNIQWVPAN